MPPLCAPLRRGDAVGDPRLRDSTRCRATVTRADRGRYRSRRPHEPLRVRAPDHAGARSTRGVGRRIRAGVRDGVLDPAVGDEHSDGRVAASAPCRGLRGRRRSLDLHPPAQDDPDAPGGASGGGIRDRGLRQHRLPASRIRLRSRIRGVRLRRGNGRRDSPGRCHRGRCSLVDRRDRGPAFLRPPALLRSAPALRRPAAVSGAIHGAVRESIRPRFRGRGEPSPRGAERRPRVPGRRLRRGDRLRRRRDRPLRRRPP